MSGKLKSYLFILLGSYCHFMLLKGKEGMHIVFPLFGKWSGVCGEAPWGQASIFPSYPWGMK